MVSVKRKAHTDNFGTSYWRLSSVTVPTTTAIFPSFFLAMNLASLEMEMFNLGCAWG